jgi:hypothetical protein
MVYLESQDNCITKDLNRAWIELENRIDSTPWGKLAEELFCSALDIQEEVEDSEELLRLLREFVKRVDKFEKSYLATSAREEEIHHKLLSPSDRRRLNKIHRANRAAAREAKARGEDNFLIRVYLRKQPNCWVNHYNSRGLCRAHRRASRPAFTQSGGSDSGNGDSDCSDPPGPSHPVTSPFPRLKQSNSCFSPWPRLGSCRVSERGCAA